MLREALGEIAILSDEAVTLKIADEALEQTKPKDQLTSTAPRITNKKENKNEKE